MTFPDPICWFCKQPVPEKTVVAVGDVPGVHKIFAHRSCFLDSPYNQLPDGTKILAEK